MRESGAFESFALFFPRECARVQDGRKINKIGRAFYFLVAGFRISIPYIHDRSRKLHYLLTCPHPTSLLFTLIPFNVPQLFNVIPLITFTFERGHSRFRLFPPRLPRNPRPPPSFQFNTKFPPFPSPFSVRIVSFHFSRVPSAYNFLPIS